jgi:hypothetical protein
MNQQPILVAQEITQVLAANRLVPNSTQSKHNNDEDEGNHSQAVEICETLPSSSQIGIRTSHRRTRRSYSSAILKRLGISLCEIEEQSFQSVLSTKCEPRRSSALCKRLIIAMDANKSTLLAYKIRISPPTWLLNRAWELQLSMASCGWTFGLRTYIEVPWDAEVFEVLEHGTLDELLKLFREGRASPYSQTDNDMTLLHVRTQ